MPETVLSTFIDIMLLVLAIHLRDIIFILQKVNNFLRVTTLISGAMSLLSIPYFSLERNRYCINFLYKTGCSLFANWDI